MNKFKVGDKVCLVDDYMNVPYDPEDVLVDLKWVNDVVHTIYPNKTYTIYDVSYAGNIKLTEDPCLWYNPDQFKLVEENEMSTLNKGKFIIGTIGNKAVGAGPGEVSISKKPVEHDSLDNAKKEAERLAVANSGVEFVVLEVKGVVKSSNVLWK